MVNLGTLNISITANSQKAVKELKDVETAMSKQTKAVLQAEAGLKKYYAMQAKGLTISSQSQKHMASLETTYKNAGGSVDKLKEQAGGMYDQWGRTGFLGKANSSLNALRWTMVNVGFAVAAVGVPLAMMTKQWLEFEDVATKISAIGGGSISEIMGDISNIRMETPFSLKDSGEALLEFQKQGFSTEDSLKAFPNILNLALGGFTSMSSATTIVSQNLHAFNLTSDDTERVVNAIGRAANASAADVETFGTSMSFVAGIAFQLGENIEDTAGMIAILTNMGLKGGKSGRNLAAAYTNLLKPSDTALSILKQLGVEIQNTDGSMRSMVDIVTDLNDATSEYTNKTEILANIFGTQGARAVLALMTSLEESDKSLREMLDSFNNEKSMAEVAASANMSAAKRISIAWNNVKSSMTNDFAWISNRFADFVTGVDMLFKASERADKIGSNIFAPIPGGAMLSELLNPTDLTEFETRVQRAEKGAESVGNFLEYLTKQEFKQQKSAPTKKFELESSEMKTARLATESLAISYDALFLSGVKLEKIKLEQTLYSWINELKDAGKYTETTRNELIQYSIEQNRIIDETDRLNKSIDEWETTQSYLNKQLSSSKDVLSELNSELKTYKDDVNNLLNMRFAGQTDAEEAIYAIEYALKQEKLRVLELGDAADSTGDSLSSMNNEYTSWVDTIKTFITEAINAGDDLGKNVTGVVKTFQTKLMGMSLSGSETGTSTSTATEEMERELEILRLKYELSYGDMNHQVELAKTLHEEEANGVANSANQIVSALNSKWAAIDNVTYAIEQQEEVVAGWTSQLEFAKDEVTRLKNELKDLQNQISSGSGNRPNSSQSQGYTSFVAGGYATPETADLLKRLEGDGYAVGGQITRDGLAYVHKNEVIRPASGNKPYSSSMESSNGIGNITVNVTSSNINNPQQLGREIAQQIKAELRRI